MNSSYVKINIQTGWCSIYYSMWYGSGNYIHKSVYVGNRPLKLMIDDVMLVNFMEDFIDKWNI